MLKKSRKEYWKPITDVMELLRNEQAHYQEKLNQSITDKDKDYWTKHLQDSYRVYDWLNWQLMIINPD